MIIRFRFFQIIGFEVEHPDEFDDIKNWTNNKWNIHLDLLMNLVQELNLNFTLSQKRFVSMFGLSHWWKQEVYLMNKNNLFSPVLTPSIQMKTIFLWTEIFGRYGITEL
ncbi:unnamed protein product [Onchocerca flexuosa]|uniref:Uncharacterized protein n=1 Tax=Onchocerca flexuosa TaxID=387005 RepID=A0A183I214_9BILA|nr:unnamed protein product [Onchocerca flexuosa]